MRYVGRFAPSPTGPLHVGSLTTAVASYLHARQQRGEWLVRIEDIDPPREAPGAADAILRTLESYALEWDRSVLYQSSRRASYEAHAHELLARGLAFRCNCSRRMLQQAGGGPYPGSCRDKKSMRGPAAVRMRVEHGRERLADRLQGEVHFDLQATLGDYVIRRRDALPAYHLAVVVDDATQGITAVVRGVDLLESTAAHLHLQRALGIAPPLYYHLPVIVDAAGIKLSKQTGARPVPAASSATAAAVLGHLGLTLPKELVGAPPAKLWEWALGVWSIERLRSVKQRSDHAC